MNDEREKGTLAAPKLLRLMSLDLSNSDSPLKDYISGGQKEARIVSVKVDLEMENEEKGHEEKEKFRVYPGGTDCGGRNPVHTAVYRGA